MTERELTQEAFLRKREELWRPHIRDGRRIRRLREAKRPAFPLVRVEHPGHGTVMVRAESNCDALHQAAEAWGTGYLDISAQARVSRSEAIDKEEEP